MSFAMQACRFPNGGFPESDSGTPKASATYGVGTLLTYSSGIGEHAGGATVTGILGVSYEGCVSAVADNPSGKVNYAKATRANTFMAKLTDGSGVIQTVTTAHLNVKYGVLKNSTLQNQWWSVDVSDTTDVVVQVESIDTELNVVIFKFLESAIQQP